MMKQTDQTTDVIVIGAGAAGMMAACQAALCGARVLLLEKNEKAGKKIYITGKGRCNFTNACETEDFFENVPQNASFLYSSVYSFDPHAVIEWFEAHGVRTKIERGLRAFPQSDHASDITRCLEKEMRRLGVEIRLNTEVEKLLLSDSLNEVGGVCLKGGARLFSRCVIVAAGGLSYPSTGSTGDGYRFARETGHTVGRLSPSLVPFEVQEEDIRKLQGSAMSVVFQEPMSSMDPCMRVGPQIEEALTLHTELGAAERREKALQAMHDAELPDPPAVYMKYPHEMSGGMLQRAMIAAAIINEPDLLICDEPTTALDVTIQAQIIKLIKDLQKELGFTTIYITHDLGVVANVADRVGVMYGGQIIEYGTVNDIFYDPQHPYTWALLSALPQLGVKGEDLYYITGTPPSLYNKIDGDAFAPRNPQALKIDFAQEPPFFRVSDTHYAKTWLLDPRAPKVEKPEAIRNLHEKILRMTSKGGAFHVGND